MWLIDISTYSLKYHHGPENVEYFILSHTWEDEEVTFNDMTDLAKAEPKKGFVKIKGICQLARDRGVSWAWVDTCCIDKSSSAELTEAINSMFRWYKEAAECVAFLADLPPLVSGSAADSDTDMAPCKWFTRGWTLQELIAPAAVSFFDQSWTFRGTKATLAARISAVTGVDREVLLNSVSMYALPVGRRMSWAADRKTTRIEDQAYCLLGIFDVNMSLIYGEGEKAFLRLQETIAREVHDLSLLAWCAEKAEPEFRGAFAQSPREFLGCRLLVNHTDPLAERPPLMVTSKGLQMEAALGVHMLRFSTGTSLLRLGCRPTAEEDADEDADEVCIGLVKVMSGFVRHMPNQLLSSYRNFNAPMLITIPKHLDLTMSIQATRRTSHSFKFRLVPHTEQLHIEFSAHHPRHLWDDIGEMFLSDGYPKFIAFADGTADDASANPPYGFTVVCGLAEGSHPSPPTLGHRTSECLRPVAFLISGWIDHEPWACDICDDKLYSSFDAVHSYLTISRHNEPTPKWAWTSFWETLCRCRELSDTPRAWATLTSGQEYHRNKYIPGIEARVSIETDNKDTGPVHTINIQFRGKYLVATKRIPSVAR